VPEPAFERAATHSERGRITLLDLLRDGAAHAEGHAQQIMRTREKYRESRAKS
jgi:hypothetical protein